MAEDHIFELVDCHISDSVDNRTFVVDGRNNPYTNQAHEVSPQIYGTSARVR